MSDILRKRDERGGDTNETKQRGKCERQSVSRVSLQTSLANNKECQCSADGHNASDDIVGE